MKISELISEAIGLPATTNPREIAAAKAAKLASYSSNGTQQQQAQQPAAMPAAKGPLASKDTSNATDVGIKVPGQSAATVQKAQTAAQIASAQKTAPKQMGSAPTLGAPVAAQGTQAAPTGFLGGLAQGFKKGMGMDPDQGIAANLAQSGLSKLGMTAAARSLDPARTPGDSPVTYMQPGKTIADPITGRGTVRVMANPGGKGVKLDTTKTLGYPITVDPKDIK
jgi:hypothetical protein